MSVGKKNRDANVSVVCRFRPQNSLELSEGGKNVVEMNDEKTQVVLKVGNMDISIMEGVYFCIS